MSEYRIVEDDLAGAEVLDLLEFHLAEIRGLTPVGKMHALPIERLSEPDVAFFSAWDDDTLAAVGALRELAPDKGELKSMRAVPEYRGKGAGEAILLHLIGVARGRGYAWLVVETGKPEPWRHARNLYRKHGFTESAPFGDYQDDGFSLCMSLEL